MSLSATGAEHGSGVGPEPASAWVVPPRAVALFTLFTLFFVNLTGYLDRQIVSLLVQPIKAALKLSDGMIGLMQGLAFVIAYAIAGLLIGQFVDRHSRRNLLIVCVLIWSLCSAAGGLAHNGGELFLARMGVGVGEAALIPCAVSLLSDSFERDRRGMAMGVFTVSVHAGSGLSLMIVGLLLPAITAWAATLSVHGTIIEVWRLVLFCMLGPGVAVCALLAFVREPPRVTVSTATKRLDATGFRDWAANVRVLAPHHIAFALVNLSTFTLAAWFPTVLIREHHLDTRHTALIFGGVGAVAGGLGAFLSGPLGDRLSRHAGTRGRISVALYCLPVAAVATAGLFFAHTLPVLVSSMAVMFGMQSLVFVIGLLTAAELAPPRSRGQVTAIFMTFAGIIGAAGGPAIAGYLNDALHSRGVALSTIMGATCLVAVLCSVALITLTLARIDKQR